jgi:hypothetical protein
MCALLLDLYQHNCLNTFVWTNLSRHICVFAVFSCVSLCLCVFPSVSLCLSLLWHMSKHTCLYKYVFCCVFSVYRCVSVCFPVSSCVCHFFDICRNTLVYTNMCFAVFSCVSLCLCVFPCVSLRLALLWHLSKQICIDKFVFCCGFARLAVSLCVFLCLAALGTSFALL